MKRNFALRIDSLLGGVRSSLDAIVEYLRHHVPLGDLSEEEFRKYCQLIGKSMYGTIEFSKELYGQYPNITSGDLKSEPSKS